MYLTLPLVFLAILPWAASTIYYCGEPVTRPYGGSRVKRLVGNRDTEVSNHSWPWAAFLLIERPDGSYSQCGATLIDAKDKKLESDILVTAASCVTREDTRSTSRPVPYDPDQVAVVLGAHDLNQVAAGQEYIAVAEIKVYKDYKYNVQNDIALLRLDSPVRYTDAIIPICLKEKYDEVSPIGKQCYVAGWGRINDESDDRSAILRQLFVPVHNDNACTKNEDGGWGGIYREGEMLCAGSFKGDSGTCTGDSGGMLACEHKNGKFFLYGIATGRQAEEDDCVTPGEPSLFTRLDGRHLTWIYDERKTLTRVK